MMKYYMGIDIGGTKIAYGLFNAAKELVAKEKAPTDCNLEGAQFFLAVAQKIREYRDEIALDGGELAGVGIGITGFVDFERGALTRTASLPRLNHFAVVDFLRGELGGDLQIVLDNDCHCGALAEYRRGAGKGHRDMLYCPVSTGISTGIIIGGKLFRGSNGASGESGHMLADAQEGVRIPCSCGNSGCFNSLGSGKAITAHVRNWLEAGEESIMPMLAGGAEYITAVHISEAWERGDVLAQRAVSQMVHYLAIWIFDVYMLLNVDCIVFSGGLLAMGEKLIDRVIEEFEGYHTNGFPVLFYQTELGVDSGLIGAVELLFDE